MKKMTIIANLKAVARTIETHRHLTTEEWAMTAYMEHVYAVMGYHPFDTKNLPDMQFEEELHKRYVKNGYKFTLDITADWNNYMAYLRNIKPSMARAAYERAMNK